MISKKIIKQVLFGLILYYRLPFLKKIKDFN